MRKIREKAERNKGETFSKLLGMMRVRQKEYQLSLRTVFRL
jgi:hypothetical protein